MDGFHEDIVSQFQNMVYNIFFSNLCFWNNTVIYNNAHLKSWFDYLLGL